MRTPVDPGDLRRGDRVRFANMKGEYILQWMEEKKEGQAYAVVCGPLGSQYVSGGHAVYVGPKRIGRVDLVTGRRVVVKPSKVFRVDQRKAVGR